MSRSRPPKNMKKSGKRSAYQNYKRKKKIKKYQPYRMRVPQVIWLVPLAFLFGFGSVFGFFISEEVRTSKMQAEYLTDIAKEIHYHMREGEAPDFFVPNFGPYNRRLGYSYLPFFIKSLKSEGFHVASQLRASMKYHSLVQDGFYPVYQPKTVAGLYLRDRNDNALYKSKFPTHVFANYDAVPKILVDTLLFIENRELLRNGSHTRNPVIEWDRFVYAAMGQVLKYFVSGINLGGGSTLATQIEKFRFSPGGQTRSPMDKIKQIFSASLRVYMQGEDTREARKKIILDYLNSTPLSARRGFGEINSIGDGIWAWFGRDINELTIALNLPETDAQSLRMKAMVYREALGLILSQRRPTYYLLTDRTALDELTDRMLDQMAYDGVISHKLRDASRAIPFRFLPEPPRPPHTPFLDLKATNAMRNHLMSMLGVRNYYELDRLDLTVTSTLDKPTQQSVAAFLKKMDQPEHLKEQGFIAHRLLEEKDNAKEINWSVVLYERLKNGNALRVQADNINGPLDMNEGVKLDLGSTAKLRTLVTYLEVIGELYKRYTGLSPSNLRGLHAVAPDVMTAWATQWMAWHPRSSMDEMLQAAMLREYSANPHETFFTGGGAHTFGNFSHRSDNKSYNLHEALRDSVNLVFIRLMRDVVNYTIAQGQQTKKELFSDPSHPARREYLERYADKEGRTFLNRFMRVYKKKKAHQLLSHVTKRSRKGASAKTIIFRTVRPNASFDEYATYMQTAIKEKLSEKRLEELYVEYQPGRYNYVDRGYITGLNPLELWLVGYKIANPKATRSQILAVSKPIRIESYAWLFHSNKKSAQDRRIRILLEQDSFTRIQKRWERLGYPFKTLVPSYATAIGSSADRPGALAELVGILVNDGVRQPVVRFESLHFAKGTPFETIMEPSDKMGRQVLEPSVARVARSAMIEVVENGTARRLRGAYTDAQGNPILMGAKTGTGDHRFDEYGPNNRLISSRVVNRTGTIMFFIGDRFFGTVTAHVAGEKAGNFKFTSSLSTQMLKSLAPIFQPLVTKSSVVSMVEEAKPIIIQAPLSPEELEAKRKAIIEEKAKHKKAPLVDKVIEIMAPSKQSPKSGTKVDPEREKHLDKVQERQEKNEMPSSYELMMDILPQ